MRFRPKGKLKLPSPDRPLLLVVEGILDVSFLTRLSTVLHVADPTIPDLSRHVAQGTLVIVPIGGGDLSLWTHRLAPLGCREFDLFDRESEPETSRRRNVIREIDCRPQCHAVLTHKRALENDLHPTAIAAVTGVTIAVDDDRDVIRDGLTARASDHCIRHPSEWRDRRRQAFRLKRLLNAQAVDHMTAEWLAERDPEHELIGWPRHRGMHPSNNSIEPQLTETKP